MNHEELKEACASLGELLVLKNKKYGDSFTKIADEYGSTVMVLRIDDKLCRLKQLLLNGETTEGTDETIEDTLIDIAGYAMLASVYLDNKKQLKGLYREV